MELREHLTTVVKRVDDRLPKNCTREHSVILIAKTIRRPLAVMVAGFWLALGIPLVLSRFPLAFAPIAWRVFLWGLVVALLLTAFVLSLQALIIKARYRIHNRTVPR